MGGRGDRGAHPAGATRALAHDGEAVTRGRTLAAVLATLCVASSAGAAPPAQPFATLAASLHVGTTVMVRGAAVTLLVVADGYVPPAGPAYRDARTDLAGPHLDVQDLPGVAGRWHVRVANHGERPVLAPAGEALLTPAGPSRAVDRPVWIPAHAATFVPVVQGVDPPPSGPYLSRGRGLTPFEQTLVDLDVLGARVRRRNAVLGVDSSRKDDMAAAYTTARFVERYAGYDADLRGLADRRHVVGVLVADDLGPCWGTVESDPARFAARWPSIREGIAIDAMLVADRGVAARTKDLSRDVGILVRALATTPLERPNFGVGTELRYEVTGVPHATGAWEGLAIGADPVTATLRLERAPSATRPTPPGGDGTPGTPGLFEGGRRLRPTPFEDRVNDRRTGASTTGPSTSAGGGTRGPSLPSGPSSAPTTPRPTPSPGATPRSSGGGASPSPSAPRIDPLGR